MYMHRPLPHDLMTAGTGPPTVAVTTDSGQAADGKDQQQAHRTIWREEGHSNRALT